MNDEEVMSQEDKFFGKSNVVGDEPKDEIELEIVDDRPPEDRRPPAKAEDEENDEELQSYSAKVRKRIDKLKFQQHEERRQREAAERMREEAVRVAQELAERNKKYEQVIQRGETALVQQIKARASLALEQAKSAYKDAYERGDSEKIIDAQEKLLNAQGEVKEAERYERNLKARPEKPVETTTNQQPVKPNQPSKKAMEWVSRNPWFGPQGNREMTALAYGVHESLVRDHGVQPDTDEYYQKIDEAIRARFPEHFERDNAQRQPAPVVAPSTRNNGAKPRRIQLTATQVSLAKRLGLTPEQYAKQLIKESANGR